MRLDLYWRILGIALLGGCSVHSQRMSAPPAAASAALSARADQFSQAVVRASASEWSTAELDMLTNFYTEEAVLFPPKGDAIRGREAVRRYWTRTPERKILQHSIRTERVDIDGALAADHGTFAATYQTGSEAPTNETANFISVWRRGPDGVWRKQLDSWW